MANPGRVRCRLGRELKQLSWERKARMGDVTMPAVDIFARSGLEIALYMEVVLSRFDPLLDIPRARP